MGAFLGSHELCDPLEAESHIHKRALIPCLASEGVTCKCLEEHWLERRDPLKKFSEKIAVMKSL